MTGVERALIILAKPGRPPQDADSVDSIRGWREAPVWRREWIRDIGLIGSQKGKGEKDLLLPPGYEGEVPTGYDPFYSKTWKVLWFVRYLSTTGSYEEAVSYAQQTNA